MRWVRIGLEAIAWIAIALAAFVLSFAYHLSLPETRAVARGAIEDLASDALEGSLTIGSIEELSLSRVVFHDVVMFDDQGRAVISAHEVIAIPDLDKLVHRGVVRIAGARVIEPDITLYTVDEYGRLDTRGLEVSFTRAFIPTDQSPSDASPPPHVRIGHLSVEHAYVHGDVPRYPGLVIEDLSVIGQIDIQGSVLIRAYDGSGRMTGPYPGETFIDDADVRFSTDWQDGVTAYLALHRGTDLVSADVRVDRPDGWPDDGPPRLSVWVRTDPVCAHTLAEMGFPNLDRFDGCGRGWTHLYTRPEGPNEDIVFDSTLATDAGVAFVRGELPAAGHWSFELRTEGLELARLVPMAPEVHLAGTGRIELLDGSVDGTVGIVTVDVDGFEVAGYAIPGFQATGALRDDAILIERVVAPHLDGQVSLAGRVGFDGSLDVSGDVDVADIGADPNVARLLPGAHGAVRGHLTVRSGPGGERLEIDSTFDARHVRYGPLRTDTLRGRVWARGDAPTPELVLRATGEGVSVSGVSLGHVDVTADGGGHRRYGLTLRAHGGRDVRSASIDAHAVRSGEGLDVTLDAYTVDAGIAEYSGPHDGAPPRLLIRGPTVTFENLHLESEGGAALTLAGPLRPSGRSDLHFSVRGLPLASLASRLPAGLSRLTGSLDADVTLAGVLRDPDLTVEGQITDASLDGTRGFHLGYRFHYADGTLESLIDGDLGTRGGVHIDGPIRAPFAVLTSPSRFLDEAIFDGVEVDLDQANLAFVLPFFGEAVRELGVAGRATLAVVLRGTTAHPELPRAVVILDRFGLPGWTPVRIKSELTYVGDDLRVERLWIADTTGEIALVEAGVHVSLDDPPEDLAGWLARIAGAPFHVAARFEPRRLDGLPRPLSKRLPRGVTVGGSVTLYSGPDGSRGSLEAILRWEEAVNAEPCAHDLRPVLQIHAASVGAATVAQIDAFVAGRPVARGIARAETPFAEWIASATVPVPVSAVTMDVHDLPLEALPWTCPYASGSVDGELAFTFGSATPDLESSFAVTGLRVHSPSYAGASTRPFHAAVAASTTGTGRVLLSTCAILSEENGPHTALGSCPSASALESGQRSTSADEGELLTIASIPVTIPEDGLGSPEVAWTDDFFFWADLADSHLEPVLAFVPGIAEADIVANGTISAAGGWETLALEGGLDLRDGRGRIASVGQHLHSISAVLRLSGNRILLPEDRPLVAMDADSRAEMTGEIGFHGLVPAWAYLTLRPDRFPVRREGAVLATLTGEASVRATIGTDGVEGTVVAETLEVGLPPTSAGGVQAIELRRDVLVIADDAPDLARPPGSHFPFHIRIEAPSFSVVRNDFSAEVRADLDVLYDSPDLFVGGTAEILRGTFEVLGKRFTVQRGALVFVGDAEMDPDVLLVASYALPGRTGASVTITVIGRLSDLSVDFSSTETNDTGEIIALLVSGRSASSHSSGASAQQAGDQAANFLAGLTAGILTLGLRQQFGGQFVPNVAVETGDRLGTVGLRVGFNADWLIPDFARDVVLAAYVEGFVSAGGQSAATQSSGSSGVGGGVSLEFQLPLNGVISGTYVPVSSGGLDLLWEP